MRRFGWYNINRTLGRIWVQIRFNKLANKNIVSEWPGSSVYPSTSRRRQVATRMTPKTWVRVTTLKSPEFNQARTKQVTNVKWSTGHSYCWWEVRQRCSMATTLIRTNTNRNWNDMLAKANSETIASCETSLRRTSQRSTRDDRRKKRDLYRLIKRLTFCKLSFGCWLTLKIKFIS